MLCHAAAQLQSPTICSRRKPSRQRRVFKQHEKLFGQWIERLFFLEGRFFDDDLVKIA